MTFRAFISFIALLSIVSLSVITGPGCANIVPPQGGARDSIPPKLLKANPGDSTRNFTGNRIAFSFNEFVTVQNIQENLLISPTPKILPSVDYKLNTVTVRMKDSLESNTTYSFNFGSAIRDVNESNVLREFTYVFSTGKYIDSLELRGKVLLAETGKIDTTLIVMLHTSPNDSAVIKDRPRYISKLDGQGHFIFRNLPPATFYLYALKDEGGTHRYLTNKQLFAFTDKPVAVQGVNDSITLYAWAALSQTAPPPTLPASNFGNRKLLGSSADKRLKYVTSLLAGEQDLLSDFTMLFEQPLRSFDSTKMRLYTDSTFTPVANYSIKKDSTGKKLVLKNDWKEKTRYHLILDKEFADDSTGKKLLKTDTLSFKSKELIEYGVLKLTFRNLDLSKNPVLLFILNSTVVKSFPLTNALFTRPIFLPGEYELRILYDANKNGKWDPGEFFGKHLQPELVKPIDRHITIKAGGENEFEIAL
jgi:Bacterial Ig-like domain